METTDRRRNEHCRRKAVVSIQNCQGRVFVSANQQHRGIDQVRTYKGTQALKLGKKVVIGAVSLICANLLNRFIQSKASMCRSSPGRSGEYADPCQVLDRQLDFEPSGVKWQFAPHGAAAKEKQCSPQSVFFPII